MNLRDFAIHHGLRTIVRRHAVYNKPALPVDNNLMCALIYSRAIDPQLLGLNYAGKVMMRRQGELLVEMDLVPDVIFCGQDQRNIDGARETAAGINKLTNRRQPSQVLPHVTYPVYDATKAYEAWQKFGDTCTHMYLAERPEVEGLWTESAADFESRIVAAVEADYWMINGRSALLDPHPAGTKTKAKLTLFDLNFEQLTLLHYLHVEKIRRQDIPCGPNAWCPVNGGGIAYGQDGTVMEFDPNFEMIIKVVA